MTSQTDVYEIHIQPLHQVKSDIEKNEYQCISCLGIISGNFKKVLTDPTSKNYASMGELYTCEHCLTKTLAVSEQFLGAGNIDELTEYQTVHAEWHNELV